jgi:alkylation response protein AidB-like acyl-CoA dehydrogenase
LNALRQDAQTGGREIGEVLHNCADYVARAHSLGALLAAASDEIERNRELPASIVSALIDKGLFRIRLASTWAIHQAREVVNTLYHSAGSTAIFDDRPFERRFRDMHTASQQAQGRQAHYETIGRILFGLAPDTAMFAF